MELELLEDELEKCDGLVGVDDEDVTDGETFCSNGAAANVDAMRGG
jgi:hypothetical protein